MTAASEMSCVIQRRLLVNYRIDPAYVAPLLPPPFRPQLVSGYAVGGVCLIRLGGFRLAGLPTPWPATENAAHRFAVEWDGEDGTEVGVYVPRRDTSSRATAAAGGRVFPGQYRLARFRVAEPGGEVRVAISSRDGEVRLDVAAAPAASLGGQLFTTLAEATEFFRRGALGFSPAASGRLDAVRLRSGRWDARPMSIGHIRSSLFDDPARFPPGTCSLDSALIMRDLPARWTAQNPFSAEKGFTGVDA